MVLFHYNDIYPKKEDKNELEWHVGRIIFTIMIYLRFYEQVNQ